MSDLAAALLALVALALGMRYLMSAAPTTTCAAPTVGLFTTPMARPFYPNIVCVWTVRR